MIWIVELDVISHQVQNSPNQVQTREEDSQLILVIP